MKKEELRDFQLKQLVLLDKVDEICSKENIIYYLIGGTLLGAIRHKGFIPWDCDLDIAMPRKDYVLFKQVCSKYFGDEFFYEDYTTEKYHNSPHAILRIRNTFVEFKRLHNVDKKKKEKGFFLDIFPLDEAPVEEELQIKQAEDISKVRKVMYYKECQTFDTTKWFVKLAKKCVKLCLSFRTFYKLGKKLEAIETQYNGCGSGYLVSMSSHYSYKKQLMKSEIYGIPSKIEFEGKLYLAPQDIDAYLTKIYGNYRKLPPEGSRYDYLEEISFADYRN